MPSDEQKLLNYIVSKDPKNKQFGFFFEIPKFRPFDFIFDLKGQLSRSEFEEKTKMLRSYPKHLLYTLFIRDEKYKQVRQREFPIIFFLYDDIKQNGGKFYRKGKFQLAFDNYCYVYK